MFKKCLKISQSISFNAFPFKNIHFNNHHLFFYFSYPKFQKLTMPALSPTMEKGKIVKWNKNEGDKCSAGDSICDVQTDKATVAYEIQDEGYLAKIFVKGNQTLNIGDILAIMVKNKEDIQSFKDFSIDSNKPKTVQPKAEKHKDLKKITTPKQINKQVPTPSTSNKKYPNHIKLTMPALSPTMQLGKIVKWVKKEGQEISDGDILCQVQTDKATLGYEVNQKGYLAKILIKQGESGPVGMNFAIITKQKNEIKEFEDYKQQQIIKETIDVEKKLEKSKMEERDEVEEDVLQILASPAARRLAKVKGISLKNLIGSGPDGRILTKDVQNPKYKQEIQSKIVTKDQIPIKKETKVEQKVKEEYPLAKEKIIPSIMSSQKSFEIIQLSSMRKSIASRLSQSKSTIPHFYLTNTVLTSEFNKLRVQLNSIQKDIKISVNDFVCSAIAKAIVQVQGMNVQWGGDHMKKFKDVDLCFAVATNTGLITPILFGANRMGLKQLSSKAKELANKARQGKLQPKQFIGGTVTVTNVGMYGVDSVIPIINPPQSLIVGVGKNEKKAVQKQGGMVFVQAMIMTIAADHRVIDGALGAQFMKRLKELIENPRLLLL